MVKAQSQEETKSHTLNGHVLLQHPFRAASMPAGRRSMLNIATQRTEGRACDFSMIGCVLCCGVGALIGS